MNTNQTKSAYVEKLEARLDQWDAKIQQYEAGLREAKADARSDLETGIENLRGARNAAKHRLEEARKIGDDAWNEVADVFETSWTRTRETFDALLERLA